MYHECKLFKPRVLTGGDVKFSLTNMSDICKKFSTCRELELHCWDTRDRQAIQWGQDAPLITYVTHKKVDEAGLRSYVESDSYRARYKNPTTVQHYANKLLSYMPNLHKMMIAAYDAVALPPKIKAHIKIDNLKEVLCKGNVCSDYKVYQCALTDIYLFYLLLKNNRTYSMVYGGYYHTGAIHKFFKHFAKVAEISCVTVDIMSKPFAFNTECVDSVANELMRQQLPSCGSKNKRASNNRRIKQ